MLFPYHHLHCEPPASNFTSIIVFQTSPPTSRAEGASEPIDGASLRRYLLSEAPNGHADIATM